MRGLLLGGKVTPARAADMVADYATLRIARRSMTAYMARVLELRHDLSAYDAFHVALAEAFGCELVTVDAKLAAKSPGDTSHTAKIRLVSPA